MPGLSLPGGAAAPAALRRPLFEVSLGGGGDPWKTCLVALTVEAGLAPGADVAELLLAAHPDAPVPALGDAGSLSLGYEDAGPEVVFTGEVAAVRRAVAGGTRVTLTNGGATLSRLRVNQGYEGESAGAIVKELAGRAGVQTGTVQDGVPFPYYVVDDRTGAWGHVARLARLSGHLAYLAPDGALHFAPYEEGEPAQSFAYGADLLGLELAEAAPVVAGASAVGEGAAGSQGADAWAWLVKDPAPVTREAGEAPRLAAEGALRSSDAAQQAAEGITLAASRLALTGRLLVPGAPAVAVGSTVEVTGAPQEALNGRFLVRRVRHRYGKQEGFTTLLDVSGGGSTGGLGGLL